jgi:hypothetical protein
MRGWISIFGGTLMAFKDKLSELDSLYCKVHRLITANNLDTINREELFELNSDVEKIQIQIQNLEDELFFCNPNYVGDISTRMH